MLGASSFRGFFPASVQLYRPSLTLPLSWWWGWWQRTERRGQRDRGAGQHPGCRMQGVIGWVTIIRNKQRKRCVSFTGTSLLCLSACFELNLVCRTEHARMLWWTASLVPWRLHPAAWCTSSKSWVCSGPSFDLLRSRWVFSIHALDENEQFSTECDCY